MTDRRNKMLIATPVMLAVLAVMPVSAFAEKELEFTYSDEWSVVSAPPPSGPYRVVHIDPRVPGQGVTPPVTSSFEMADPALPLLDESPGKIDSTATTAAETQPLVTERVDARDQAATGIATAVPMAEENKLAEPTLSGDGVAASAPKIDDSDNAAVSMTPADEQSRMATGAHDAAPAIGTIAIEDELPASDELLHSEHTTTAQDSGTEVLVPPTLSTSTDRIDAVKAPAAAAAPVGVVKPAPVAKVPARENNLAAPILPPAVPGHYAPGLPAIAGREAVMPPARPPLPGVSDNTMPPPAAGVPGAAIMPPATGRPGNAESYGRMMPRPPAYNYPGRNWQPGYGMPGYGNMPPYGYYRGPADDMGSEVPPPGRYVPPPNYGGQYPGR